MVKNGQNSGQAASEYVSNLRRALQCERAPIVARAFTGFAPLGRGHSFENLRGYQPDSEFYSLSPSCLQWAREKMGEKMGEKMRRESCKGEKRRHF